MPYSLAISVSTSITVKRKQTSQLLLSAEQALLLRLAEASAEVDTARTVALVAADILDVNPAPNPFITARILRDSAFAARLCNNATKRLFEAAGATVELK